jgi:hypothetical protein
LEAGLAGSGYEINIVSVNYSPKVDIASGPDEIRPFLALAGEQSHAMSPALEIRAAVLQLPITP